MAHLERDPATGDVAPVATPTEARQARKGLPVLYVLVGGLALALIAWAGVEMYRPEPAPLAPATDTTAPATPAPAAPAAPDTSTPPPAPVAPAPAN